MELYPRDLRDAAGFLEAIQEACRDFNLDFGELGPLYYEGEEIGKIKMSDMGQYVFVSE